MKRTLSLMILAAILLAGFGGNLFPNPSPHTVEDDGCISVDHSYHVYLPLIAQGEKPMTSSIQARLAAARQAFSNALGGQFQKHINFRTGQVDYVNYSPDGRLLGATVTIDGVSGLPVSADTGAALHVGDSIEMINWGSAAGPDLQYNRHIASNYADAATSPAATLPTPIGLALTSTWRAADVAAIFASWRSLTETVMGSGGFYELMIKRDDEVDGHVSRCPHSLPSTTLDGSATAGDSTIEVISTEGLPASGRVLVGDAEVVYTDRTSTELSGCTWVSGSGTYDSGTGVTALTQAFVFENLTTNTGYNVRVRAVSNGAVSDWSEWASITTSLPDAPDTPSLTVITVEGGFEVSWSEEVLANSYTLQWATDGSGTDAETKFIGNALYKFIPADGSHTYFHVKASGLGGDSSYSAWETDSTAPPTPTGFTAGDGTGKVTVAVALGTDTSHSATGFKEWELQQSDTGTGGGTNVVSLPALRVSGGVATMDIVLDPGTKFYRIRAVDWAGNASSWTSWEVATSADPNAADTSIEDRFDGYGGSATSSLDSLWWLWISSFEQDWTVIDGVGVWDTSATYVKEGAKAFHGTAAAGNLSTIQKTTVWTNFNQEGRFTSADFLTLAVYLDNVPTSLQLRLEDSSSKNATYTWASPAAGWHFYKVKRSDISADAGFDWTQVSNFYLVLVAPGGGSRNMYVDDLRIVKADPDAPALYNDTGPAWDFVPAIGSGTEAHIYPGNRSGEPAKPFSLGFIYTTASPTNWSLAYHTLSDVSSGVGIAGVYLKGVDGTAALAFDIQDASVANRTLYAVELDTAANAVNLVRWVNGTRTLIATKAFTANPDTEYWIGFDSRDRENPGENRIKVYASATEGNLIQASNLVISTTDGNIARGGPVGVMTKEANVRFFYFRAGSFDHAMSAEYSYRAAVADQALTVASAGKYLTGEIKLWPSASLPNAATEGVWLLCDGTAYSQATYAALYAVIGTTFGVGGAGTFKVPDFRDNSPQGASATDALAAVVGVKLQTNVPSHHHSYYYKVLANAGNNANSVAGAGGGSSPVSTSDTGTVGGVDQRGPRLAVNFIIKA